MKTADVIIIGGGVIGFVIARQLAKHGASAVLLERSQPGREASWAAAGMLAPQCENIKHEAFSDLLLKSRELYPDFCEQLKDETGVDVEYRTQGAIMPAFNETEYERLKEDYGWQFHGVLPGQELTSDEVLKLEPNLSPDIRGALYFPWDRQVENRKLSYALSLAAINAGVEIVQGVQALSIISRGSNMSHGSSMSQGSKVTGVRTTGGDFSCETVVNAAGSWANSIGGVAESLRPPVRPVKGQILALDMGSEPLFRHVIYSKRYFVPRLDGQLVVGSTVEDAGYDKRVTAEGVSYLLNGALEMAPVLKNCSLSSTYAGLRPGTPDELPILGATELAGLIMAVGHYRNGILLAPITGELICDLITTGDTSFPLEPFLLSRFDAQN